MNTQHAREDVLLLFGSYDSKVNILWFGTAVCTKQAAFHFGFEKWFYYKEFKHLKKKNESVNEEK